MLAGFKRWLDRTFRQPVEGTEEREGENTDALSAAYTGSQHTASGVQAHGNIPPNYVAPSDEGRPRH